MAESYVLDSISKGILEDEGTHDLCPKRKRKIEEGDPQSKEKLVKVEQMESDDITVCFTFFHSFIYFVYIFMHSNL